MYEYVILYSGKEREFMKKKSILILALMVVVAVLMNYIAFFGISIGDMSYGGVLDEQQGIRRGIDIAGGSVITFRALADNPTEEQMDVVEAIFSARLNNAGYTEARISRDETGKITVEIPSETDTDKAASLLGATAKLTFVDADDNVVLALPTSRTPSTDSDSFHRAAVRRLMFS